MRDDESSSAVAARQYKPAQIKQWNTIDVAAAAGAVAIHVYMSFVYMRTGISHMNGMERMSELRGNWVDIEKNFMQHWERRTYHSHTRAQ